MTMKLRQAVEALKPYEWEPSSEQLAASLGLDPRTIIRFDMNTIPFPPTKWLSDSYSRLLEAQVNDYPDTSYSSLTRLIAQYVRKGTERIVVTNGGDEALDLIAKVLVEQGSQVLVSVPTYSLYRVVVEVLGGKVVEVPRKKGFEDDSDAILYAVSDKTRLIILCSPNNPTGNTVSTDTLTRLLDESGCAVVVDEAYCEFGGKTFVDLTDRFQNLFIIRTFSKAFGLAGARVGYVVAHTDTASTLSKVRPPNSLSIISLILAEVALRDLDTVRRNTQLIVEERERLRHLIQQLNGIQVYPSEANFLLLRFMKHDATQVYRELLSKGLVTRNLTGTPMLDNCLRINMRLPHQNDTLLAALSEAVSR